MTTSTIRPFTALAASALVGAALYVPSAASAGTVVKVAGSCNAGSTMKLKLKDEDGRIEVEFEVDQNRSGVRWKWALRRNDVRVRRGSRLTQPPSGSFSVRRVIGNAAGADRIVARASRQGEVCVARATWNG